MSAPSSAEAEETQDQVTGEETALFGADNQEAPLLVEACQEATEDLQAMEDPQGAEALQVAEALQATEDFQPGGTREQISHDPLIVS